MLQSPVYIHFRSEWQTLGFDSPGQWPEQKSFQELMNQLNQPSVGVEFHDFSYRPGRCEMGRLRGNHPDGGPAFTKLVCRPNQVTLVEEWTEATPDEFKNGFIGMLRNWFELFPTTAIVAQKCCLRTLIHPTASDSRSFLGDRVMAIGHRMQDVFKGMPFKVGFTFTCLRKTRGYNLFIDTTVNSWRDNKTVWVQVEGTSPMEKPLNATNCDSAKIPFEECKSFLEDEVINFLHQCDSKD